MILLLIPLNPSLDSSFVEYPRFFSNIPVSLYVSGCTPVASSGSSPPDTLRNPAHCSKALGPSLATFNSCFLFLNVPFSSR